MCFGVPVARRRPRSDGVLVPRLSSALPGRLLGFSIFGPVRASRRRRLPQPVSPSFSRRIQAIFPAPCPALGFDLAPCAAHPLSFVFHFPIWTAPRKRTQKRTSQKARSVSGQRRAAENRPPESLFQFSTIAIIAEKTGNRWQSYFSGNLNVKIALFAENQLVSRSKALSRMFRHCRGL